MVTAERDVALHKQTEVPTLDNCSVLASYGPSAIMVDGHGKAWHLDIAEGALRPVTRQVTDGRA